MKKNKKLIIILIVLVVMACIVAVVLKVKGKDSKIVESDIETTTEFTIDTSDMVEFDDYIKESNLEPSDGVYAVLEEMNEQYYEYYQKYYSEQNLLSVYAYLYDDNASDIITAKNLLEQGVFDCDEEYINMDLLLIKPSSLAIYNNMDIDVGDNELQPFTALKIKKGYIVSSYDNVGGILTDDEYKQLLYSYIFSHGGVKTPAVGDEDYITMVNAVANESGFENYDIKYLVCDELYGVVVIGDLDNVADNREYVLVKQDTWNIAISELETKENIRWEVNNELPDMELGLLPKYSLRGYGQIKVGFEPYVDAIIELGLVNKNELPTTYTCGVGNFVYMEFSSGKYMLGCTNDKGQLEFYEVKSASEAVKYMKEYDDNPPTFIIKYSK